MKRDELHIPEPCDADWDGMTGDDKKRFCHACTKHVHNLSELDQDNAKALLRDTPNICVQYASSPSGEIFFNDSTHPMWRLHRQVEGTKRLLAAALAIPLLAACDAQETSPSAVSPVILINPDGTIKAPGSGAPPVFRPTPQEPHSEVTTEEPHSEIKMGKIAIDHDPPVQHAKGELMVEPEEIEMLRGDVAYVPAEDDPKPSSHDDDVACDSGSDDLAQPAAPDVKPNTSSIIKEPLVKPRILRGKVKKHRTPRTKKDTRP